MAEADEDIAGVYNDAQRKIDQALEPKQPLIFNMPNRSIFFFYFIWQVIFSSNFYITNADCFFKPYQYLTVKTIFIVEDKVKLQTLT